MLRMTKNTRRQALVLVLLTVGCGTGEKCLPEVLKAGCTTEAGRRLGGDFNGDGCGDLVVAASAISGSRDSPEAVYVLYGTPDGICTQRHQVWTQNNIPTGGPGSPYPYIEPVFGPGIFPAELEDGFGLALSIGDLNDDGFSDLVIGAPNEDVRVTGNAPVNLPAAGAVHVLFGSPRGLTADGSRVWYQGPTSAGSEPGGRAHFGAALAIGDFDGDGTADLAVGAPGQSTGETSSVGSLTVLFGSPGAFGMRHAWYQPSASEAGDRFGASLAVGDYDHDGVDDIAVGAPREDVGYVDRVGAVHILYGTVGGSLRTEDSQVLLPTDLFGEMDWRQAEFGHSIAAADFNGDQRVDLAVGAPGAALDAGLVIVFRGAWADERLDRPVWQWDHLCQGCYSGELIAGQRERGDRFGSSLAVGHFNGDAYADLAIGVPFDAPGVQGGSVHVLYGSDLGPLAGSYMRPLVPRNQLWTQDSGRLLGIAERGDQFGHAIAAGDFNADGFSDLVVGVSAEAVGFTGDRDEVLENPRNPPVARTDEGDKQRSGAVNIIYGSASGIPLRLPFNQLWHQDHGDIAGSTGVDNAFGRAVAAGGLQ